jgi:transcription elongation factor GreA
MERIYLTKEGHDKLIKELEELKNKKRREIAAALSHARSLGDLSENAEYDAAKEAFAHNEKRIKDLEDRLTRAELIEHPVAAGDKAYLGNKVKIADLDTGEETEYKLVGSDEANAADGSISVTSPVGKALLGKAVGDTVEVEVPAGVLKYKVVGISI